MRTSVAAFLLFGLVCGAYGAQQEPVSEAGGLFDQGQYSQGFALLNRTLRSRTITALQRAAALTALAEFYEDLIGNPDGALRYYQKVLRVRLAGNHPLKSSAREEISRLESLAVKYRQQNKLLTRPQIAPGESVDKRKIRGRIGQLEALIKENPEYYKLAEAYFCLGLHYMSLEKYGKAQKLFKKCAQLKPCIGYYLPVDERAKVARRLWVVSATNETAWGAAGVLSILAVASFYLSRPWGWLKPRHLMVGLLIMLLWWGVFEATHWWFGSRFQVTKDAITAVRAPLPASVSAAPASPGSAVAKSLFWYGLAGVAAIFVFSIAISKLRRRWAACLANVAFSLLLFACLLTIFYMRYCYEQGSFYSQHENSLRYLEGSFYFIVSEPEAYILTNPQAYPNLSTNRIRDPDFQEWVLQHCPFDKPGAD